MITRQSWQTANMKAPHFAYFHAECLTEEHRMIPNETRETVEEVGYHVECIGCGKPLMPRCNLYERWHRGETIRVSTITPNGTHLTFDIQPERYFNAGPVIGYTILIDGKPAPEHHRKVMSGARFREWTQELEEVK